MINIKNNDLFTEKKNIFENYLNEYVEQRFVKSEINLDKLKKSILYSLNNGGKRFRPVLGLSIADALGFDHKKVSHFLVAIEMIHTYSLIHDDLPCMDNDSIRRGQPTNHIIFGEAVALLAGDALLAEAFLITSSFYNSNKITQILAMASSFTGMVGGQSLDMEKHKFDKDQILNIHHLKTAALISATCEGVAVICEQNNQVVEKIKIFGKQIGLAFQIKDDILDSTASIEQGSLPAAVGLEETVKILNKVTIEAKNILIELGLKSDHLNSMLEMNLYRTL